MVSGRNNAGRPAEGAEQMRTKQVTQALGIGNLAAIKITTGAPPPPTEPERRAFFIRGARRLRGDEKGIAELESLHGEISILEQMLTEPAQDHVGPAARAAGAALHKALGKSCFASEQEAAGWATRNLPLTAAWQASARDADERMRASRQANTKRREFWALAEQVALPIARHTRHTDDFGKMVHEVTEQGAFE